jgi:hypothetical protein
MQASEMRMSACQEFVFYRTYSRWIDELGRRETWEETVDRYVNYLKIERGEKIPEKVLAKIRAGILSMEVMPSMRLLWSAGDAHRRDNTCGYNCSYQNADSVDAFVESLYILMCGTGYGFGIPEHYVSALPIVPERQSLNPTSTHVIEDSREGWADSVRELVSALFHGLDVEMDYSQLRPRGARLKTMGGRSSGPEPLVTLHNFIRDTFAEAQGRKLATIEVHDILNMVAEIVVVGGVRRSSEISLSDLDDEAMRHAKDHPFPLRRAMANNSAIYREKPTAERFLREWAALASSGTGERGIFNLEGARNRAPRRRIGALIEGTNPCAEILLRSKEFCVSGDTLLITPDRLVRIDECVGKETVIWNGKQWSMVTPRVTGISQPLVRVTLSDGSILDCTPDHRFSAKDRFSNDWGTVCASELMDGKYTLQLEPTVIQKRGGVDYDDAYTMGVAIGDGFYQDNKVYIELYGDKVDLPVDGRRYPASAYSQRASTALSVEDFCALRTSVEKCFSWSRDSILQFVAGWADADGSETGTGGIRLYISGEDRAREMQLLLSSVGIRSSVCFMSDEPTNYGSRSRPMWYLQITDCAMIPCQRLDTSNGHTPRFKGKYQTVRSVEALPGLHTTYCFDEPYRHMAVFGNVLTFQCNLTEVVVRPDDDLDSLLEKVETATWMGAIQATFTYFPYLSEEWTKNCEEERLLGVSITGQMDNPRLLSPDALAACKARAIRVARKASQILGINMPAAITCVKPSGTVSQLVDAAPGLHPRYARYYIRRYRISSTDPIVQLLRHAGMPLSPETGQRKSDWAKAKKLHAKGEEYATVCTIFDPDKDWSEDEVRTWVVSFPVAAPDGAITREDLTAIDQLEHYKKLQLFWCEHNASCTVYVRPEEWFEVGNWVYRNWEIINGVSFLPYDAGHYEQTPYEEISPEEYDTLNANTPKIDFSKLSLFERDDCTEGRQELACTGDKCNI